MYIVSAPAGHIEMYLSQYVIYLLLSALLIDYIHLYLSQYVVWTCIYLIRLYL